MPTRKIKLQMQKLMKSYGYTFNLSENNHLSIETDNESLSIIDLTEKSGTYTFTYRYSVKKGKSWNILALSQYSFTEAAIRESLCQFAFWLDQKTTLNDLKRSTYESMKAVKEGKLSVDKGLENIANNVLGIETLETRNSDSLDFHEVSVWGIKEALKQAYEMGKNSKKK